MSVKEQDVEPFQQALKVYTDATCSQLNNLQYDGLQTLHDASLSSVDDVTLCVSLQRVGPEPSRQIVLHHV